VIVEALGAGAMGEVYRARDTRLGREVALKRLVDRALDDEVAHRRILREARAAAVLSHPGIATVFDVLDTPDGLFIVMEYVPGETLGTRFGVGGVPVNAALEIGLQLARALEHAHEKGVVHRDLKPANVHITPTGQAKILDFGIAKSVIEAQEPQPGDDDLATMAGRMVGSPGYMAPEQILGRGTDARTDVYAVGVLLFELLAGRRPFTGTDVFTTAMATLNEPTPRLADIAPRVPRSVSDLVERAMARAPEDRFPSAAALAAAIERATQTIVDAETHLVDGAGLRMGGRIRKRTIATTTLLLIAVSAMVIWTRVKSQPFEAPLPVVGITPFVNTTRNQANDQLVAGLTDALTKRLASVPSLRVVPLEEVREAMKASQGRETVARTLGASFVVEGSLRRTDNAIDVDVSLRSADGLGRPIGRFSGDVARLFEFHKTITDAVALALRRHGIVAAETAPEAKPPTTNPEAFADYAQARVFLERPDVAGNLDYAIQQLNMAIGKDPKFALAYAALGEAYWAQWRETKAPEWTTKAQAANLEALRLDAEQPEVRYALAVMYEGLGQPTKAAEELKQVLSLQPRNDNAHLLLAKIAGDNGQWDEAIAEARTAIDLRPAYWRNHAQLGDTLLRAGRLDQAVAAYGRLIELQPDSARGFQRLGTVLQSLGRNDEALDNYLKAAAIRPTFATYLNMGTLYYWRTDYAKAADAYARAIQLSPGNPKGYGNLADTQLHLGRRQEAVASYRRAVDEARKLLAVNPRDTDILASLALYQAKLGDRAAAGDTARKALAINPQDGDLLFIRAQVHALAGEHDAACDGVREALAHGKNAEEIRRADELKGLKRCAAYDGLAAGDKQLSLIKRSRRAPARSVRRPCSRPGLSSDSDV
jgi:eukaryotic-like serine/threonine-protein kinase